jgi:hypothetical protein
VGAHRPPAREPGIEVRQGLDVNRTFFRKTVPAVAALFILFAGCASIEAPDGSAQRYAEILGRYPGTDDPLRLTRLSSGIALSASASRGSSDVFIIVHPGYSFFFSTGKGKRFSGARFRMMELQFENEARFIAEQARRGNIVVLIVPGNFTKDSSSPLSYTAYLNAAAGRSVFYLPSETSNNGTIATEDMVDLYRFLQNLNASKVLIGGGYIGRCQKEFHKQFTIYYDRKQTYVVREISAVSPEDVSEHDAALIVNGLQGQDYAPVARFLSKKLDEEVNILSIPPMRGR